MVYRPFRSGFFDNFIYLGKVFANARKGSLAGSLWVDGKKRKSLEAKGVTSLTGADLTGKAEVRVEGDATAYFYWQADGIVDDPAPAPAYDRELGVRRSYLSRDGTPVALDGVHQGDLIVAEVTLSGARRALSNLAIVDLLPAGFEVENPRLQGREGLAWVAAKPGRVDYLDIRDDRVMLFTALAAGESASYYYTLRAVSAGTFVLPPVKAEAMYDPTVTSVFGAGEVRIAP